MKSLLPLTCCAFLALLLTSCASMAMNEILYPHHLPHHVAFNEGDFANTLRPGSATIQGQLLEKFKDGSTYYAANMKVGLVPVNAYTSEIILRKYHNGAYLAKPDPRYAKYVRIAYTDAQGRFRFSKIPPGEYYVGCKVTYATTDTSEDSNGNTEVEPETLIWMTYAQVSVKGAQTVTISDWSSGPERITNP